MQGKRKRDEGAIAETLSPGFKNNGNVKPISAVAAAKLRSGLIPSADDSLVAPLSAAEETVSSDLDDADAEEEAPEVQHNVQLCTWRYGQDYVSSESEEQLTVTLNKGTTITLLGCFDFVVLKGAINISGANYGAGSRQNRHAPTRAFVPSTHPIATIRGLDGQNEIKFLDCDEPTPLAELNPLFAKIWNAKTKTGRLRSFALITESDADPLKRPISPEIVPEDWIRQVEDCAGSPSATLITGSPSSGISTFARRLLNRYLTGLGKSAPAHQSVFYLDLDTNKPAYSPHGQISLVVVRKVALCPPFVCPSAIPNSPGENEIVRAHPLPNNALSHYQDHFLACVEDLIHTYFSIRQQSTPPAPLIINTPGRLYTGSFSALLQLLTQIKPQRVVHLTDMNSIEEENTTKIAALSAAARKCGAVVSQISAQSRLNAISRTDADLRNMHMMSYFHCTGQTKSSQPQYTFNSKPLSHESPWEFCYEDTDTSHQAFIGFLMLGDWIEPSQLLTAFNGSIIQIVETQDKTIQEKFANLPRTNKYRIPYFEKASSGSVEPLNPKTSRLICTALLRGWDPENRIVQLIVPKTHEVLIHGLKPERTVLLAGCCETPEWAYTEDAYFQLSQQKAGGPNENIDVGGVDLPPWVATAKSVEDMGYLNVSRRIRKFQQ